MLFTFSAQAYASDPMAWPPILALTGIKDLDFLVGGVRSGDVWVVTGPPGSRRSMLCVQLAAALAQTGSPVRFFLGRDPIQEIAARLSSHTQGERLTAMRAAVPTPREPWAGWALDFVPQPELLRTDDWEALPAGGPCCLVIDDLDLWRGEPATFLPLARAHARRAGCAVILSVPAHTLRQDDPATWHEWARGCDLILSLVPRPDDYLTIRFLSRRAGPIAEFDVDPKFERVRFDTPPNAPRSLAPTAPEQDGAAGS